MNNKLQVELQHKISKSIGQCSRSLFIFEAAEDMPEGLLDAIKPFLEYHVSIDDVNFRKAIFIILRYFLIMSMIEFHVSNIIAIQEEKTSIQGYWNLTPMDIHANQ